MYTGLYIIVGITSVLLVILILSFIGPEQSESPFWQKIQAIRSVMDTVCYWFINFTAAGSLLLGIVVTVKNQFSERASTPLGPLLVGALLVILIAASIGSIAGERNRGELCECSGKCNECKIKCRSNPNYYGVKNHRVS